MKQFIVKYSSFKILFVLIFTIVFNSKLSGNPTKESYANLIKTSFFINTFDDSENLEIINVIMSECEKDEEDSSNRFSATFHNKKIFTKRDDTSNKYFNTDQFSSEKKRYYILYCQLKVYS